MGCDQCAGVDKVFGERKARGDLRRYRRRGARRSTRTMLRALVVEGISDATVLDIGGGIGAVANYLLEHGAGRAVLVDASQAYLDAARLEAARRGNSGRMAFRMGDFVKLQSEIRSASVVTLDRVICCYDDMPALVTASASKAEQLFGLVYPRDTWWNRSGALLVNLLCWAGRSGYRAFIHRSIDVHEIIEDAGLRQIFARDQGFWRVVIYRRFRLANAAT